jgi:hypothetical protein
MEVCGKYLCLVHSLCTSCTPQRCSKHGARLLGTALTLSTSGEKAVGQSCQLPKIQKCMQLAMKLFIAIGVITVTGCLLATFTTAFSTGVG